MPPWPPRAGPALVGGRDGVLLPVDAVPGLWLELTPRAGAQPARGVEAVASVATRVARVEHQADQLSDELTRRYEEIDLLYGLSGVLARTVRLEEAAALIVREVSEVVGARRASIMVHDEATGTLRTVAAQGFPAAARHAIPVDAPRSIAARVFRQRVAIADRTEEGEPTGERGYRGESFLSIPICYLPPGEPMRCVGVINLTDRAGGQAFTPAARRLVEAVATQIGSAIENARLVLRDREQQRVLRDLELARDLQRRLLPPESALGGLADVAVHFAPVDTVGGDFYRLTPLGLGCAGVMIGDVSSHGFAAALIMAVVMAAAAIHAPDAVTPGETLTAMAASLAPHLESTETHVTVFAGVLDPNHRRITWASAGHPQVFRIPAAGPPLRLDSTAPPLGLGGGQPVASRTSPWEPGRDLLCAWTDGLVDRIGPDGERFGEERLLDCLLAWRDREPAVIRDAVLAAIDGFAGAPSDDATLLLIRI